MLGLLCPSAESLGTDPGGGAPVIEWGCPPACLEAVTAPALVLVVGSGMLSYKVRTWLGCLGL